MCWEYQRLNRQLTKKILHDNMNLHIFMCVDLPDQHTIHTIEPLAFKCYQHFYMLEVSFFSLTLIYHYKL